MNTEKDYIPDPELHRNVSIAKSVFRIIGATGLCFGSMVICGGFLILAEILGIIEELV
jgi:hypothetical protein